MYLPSRISYLCKETEKGISISVLIALGTNKMDLTWALTAIAGATECYLIAHSLLAGDDK